MSECTSPRGEVVIREDWANNNCLDLRYWQNSQRADLFSEDNICRLFEERTRETIGEEAWPNLACHVSNDVETPRKATQERGLLMEQHCKFIGHRPSMLGPSRIVLPIRLSFTKKWEPVRKTCVLNLETRSITHCDIVLSIEWLKHIQVLQFSSNMSIRPTVGIPLILHNIISLSNYRN